MSSTNIKASEVSNVREALDWLYRMVPVIPNIASNLNLLINGALQVWQRGTTITNPVNTYICDRFKVNGTGTVSRTTANGGMTITGNINVRYIMENLDYSKIAGQIVTLSYLKDGVIVTDTYQSDKYSAVTGGRIVIDLNLSNCAIGWFKLELGSAATQFVPRPFAEELALCQRYALLVATTYVRAAQVTTNTIDGFFPTPTSLRTTPSLISGFAVITMIGTTQPGFTVTVSSFSNLGVTVRNTLANHGMTFDNILVAATGSALFDAEL